MKEALVLGGGSGIGLAICIELIQKKYDKIYIVDKHKPDENDIPDEYKLEFSQHIIFKLVNLVNCNYSFLENYNDVDTLIITAGFGRVASFDKLTQAEITNLILVNELAAIKAIKHFYKRIASNKAFFCGVMCSIAGRVVSPLFSVYAASKAALCSFIQSVNVELTCQGYNNRILEISPGSIRGTKFSGRPNDLSELKNLASAIVDKILLREILFIPDYEETYKEVLRKHDADFMSFGIESYNYKIANGRESSTPQCIVGYLSGTFDLFHIGHLNLIRRAKDRCDYLIVGVHKSAARKGKEAFIPFEERKEIISGIRYVDQTVDACDEDTEAYEIYKYDILFVGSDYKGTERFDNYERYFLDKKVEIVYFPYTKTTNSTQIRSYITKNIQG
ncbi:MAG: SDR family NAD(P)-dependent oxidoreductase [Oscillospiraceae bacterium]|jgi:glycerol-3-phosphate cytidylyltransferase|nr:SDR family NAD(P)-dependent oxidoreductase [Oscillospiraceae bacterium]